ncbi:helix-turn-helix transcriptional regulator [Streptomyces antimycoticus]|uniref:Helix-turn-helix transcriptional regulator n=1 Tax=Streptomyces antimycoticus TaxID=68175 RepID=A0A499VAF3_9ACTN|nr:LuxR family transcriptional regulator [Streptomyces antimycoticus]BBJ45989.1 helix-turn-helix transcriptional regulator [Streptomyces antimycoticus]
MRSTGPAGDRARGRGKGASAGLPLRGRDHEMAAVREDLETVRGGRGAYVVVEGAPGVGKSRLLAELDEMARRFGFDVVSVRADELDQYAAGAALQSALQPSGDSHQAVAATDDQRLWLLDGIADALESRAQRAPVAVVVDDAQWADPATLFVLRTLPGRLAASRILWVLAVRSEAERPTVARVREDLEHLGARWLTLGPLPQQELLHIAADVLGTRPSPGLARLLRGVAGNPFLALELVRAFADADAGTGEAGVATLPHPGIPAGFRRSVAARLDRLPEDAVRLLQIGSVLGREFDLGTAARMLGRRVGSLLSGVEAALSAGLLSADGPRLAFRHDLIRQALQENLPRAVRTALHGEAADSLRGIGARSAEVAWHVVMAGGPVDDDAVTTLTTAVQELSPSAPDAAADLAQRIASLLHPHDRRRIALLTDAAEYLGRTRRIHEALGLVDATLSDGPEPLQEACLRLAAAEIHQAAGDDAAAMTHLQRALDLPELPPDVRVRLLKTKATGQVYLGDITAAEQTDTGLVEEAYRSDDPAVVVSAMVFQSQTSFYRGRLARALELAEAAAGHAGTESAGFYLRPPRIPALWLAMVLTATDRLADTERILRDGQREAEARGLGWSLPHWHAARACALLEQGALDDAAVEAEASLMVADELEITRPNPRAHSVRALVEIRRGDLVKARDHLRAAEADSGTHTQRYGLWVVLARACLADAEGQDGAAAAALTGAFRDGEPTRLLTVGPSHWPGIVRIALRGADSSAARDVSDALRSLIARDDSQQIIGAVRAHVDGLLHRDPRALASAITAYRSGDRPLVLAAACEDLGELLATSADTTAAIPHFEEAVELASASGALRDHERIRRRLRRLGVRTGAPRHHTTGPPGWGTLTESERKLIPLVVDGLTNRAIADRLYVSVHTVNTHMKHIFTKLDINTRVELTRLAIERGAVANGVD